MLEARIELAYADDSAFSGVSAAAHAAEAAALLTRELPKHAEYFCWRADEVLQPRVFHNSNRVLIFVPMTGSRKGLMHQLGWVMDTVSEILRDGQDGRDHPLLRFDSVEARIL